MQGLGESLAELFQIQPENIEVGSTMVRRFGAIIHITHMFSKPELLVIDAANVFINEERGNRIVQITFGII